MKQTLEKLGGVAGSGVPRLRCVVEDLAPPFEELALECGCAEGASADVLAR